MCDPHDIEPLNRRHRHVRMNDSIVCLSLFCRLYRGVSATVLVELLLRRGTDDDLRQAEAAIERLAAVPTDPGLVLYEIPLLRLRGLVAQARGDDVAYRKFMESYRTNAAVAGFEALITAPDATPTPPPNTALRSDTV
jgi:hypothetical protein